MLNRVHGELKRDDLGLHEICKTLPRNLLLANRRRCQNTIVVRSARQEHFAVILGQTSRHRCKSRMKSKGDQTQRPSKTSIRSLDGPHHCSNQSDEVFHWMSCTGTSTSAVLHDLQRYRPPPRRCRGKRWSHDGQTQCHLARANLRACVNALPLCDASRSGHDRSRVRKTESCARWPKT